MQGKAIRAGARFRIYPARRRRIMVVDDNLNDLLRYSAILQHEGYEVRSIASHKEAARCLNRENFDLVVVSQGATVFKGRPVIAHALSRNRKVPVLVLSRSSDIDCYLEAMQMGTVDYLEKPLAASELAAMVGRQLGLSKSSAA